MDWLEIGRPPTYKTKAVKYHSEEGRYLILQYFDAA